MAVYAWGFGKLGQLGSGSSRGSVLPSELKLDKGDRPIQICTGGLYTAIVTQKGNVYVCGCGKYGRLGLGHENDVTVPTKVTPAKDAKVSQLAAGSWHTCAVSYLGRLFSWGYNSKHNVLGRHCDLKCSLQPDLVPSLLGVTVKKVSCGHNFSLVCSEDGRMYSWGCGRHGVLGHGNEECVLEPKRITSLERIKIKTVCAGYAHCGVVSYDGRIFMFGKGFDGALGFGEDLCNKTEPVWQRDLISIHISDVSCSVGEHKGHTLALSDKGAVYAWGNNHKGKLGLGDQDTRWIPAKIPQKYFSGQCICKISVGGNHSGAVSDSGTVFTWGSGKEGKLGHAEITTVPHSYYCTKPKIVEALPKDKRAVQISCSHYHTVVLLQ